MVRRGGLQNAAEVGAQVVVRSSRHRRQQRGSQTVDEEWSWGLRGSELVPSVDHLR